MYCIVEFTGPNPTVAVAHKSWLRGTKCYWPPFWKNSSRLRSALEKKEQPIPQTWTLYEIHVVGEKYFASFDEARKVLNLPQEKLDASELSSCEPTGRARKCANNQTAEFESSDSSEEPLSRKSTPRRPAKQKKKGKPVELPVPPSLPAVPNSTLIPPETAIQTPSLVAVAGTSMLNEGNLGHHDAVSTPNTVQEFETVDLIIQQQEPHDFVTLGQAGYENYLQTPSSMPFPPVAPFDVVGSDDGLNEAKVDEALKEIRNLKEQQEIIKTKLDLVLDLLRHLCSGQRSNTVIAPELSTKFAMPLTSTQDFERINQELTNSSESREELILILSTRGGNTANEITYRIMSTIMTDDLMNKYSLAGAKGKLGFRDTLLCSCLCDAVRRQPKGAAASDKEVEKAIDYWLKRASARLSKKADKEAG